ncbi:MAG TPA: VIT1/CCC1 family protein [Actinomycetota bacterium]|nr:VIT1/CCC1 family protein [Actinomycetota bacterium]
MGDAERFREHWAAEMDGALLYRALAERSEGEQREIFLELARAEERHAAHWAAKLEELGEPAPRPEDHRPSLRARLLAWAVRRLGARAMLPVVERAEAADATHYDHEPAAKPSMAIDERIHRRVVASLSPTAVRAQILRGERWHRGDASGSLRAAVFGANDGLVSNLALVMGVAGSRADERFVLLAGVAGLLAGAFSMGAGEYVSVRSQRELFEREIALEAEELEAMPEEEENELALIYRAKGIPKEEAELLAKRIMADPAHALDTKAREELGLNPEELGSPWGVAIASFLSFALGAAIPVLPFAVAGGGAAFVGSLGLAAVGLFGLGAAVSLLTGRPMLRGGLRQLAIGALAAAATFGIGRAIGVSVS